MVLKINLLCTVPSATATMASAAATSSASVLVVGDVYSHKSFTFHRFLAPAGLNDYAIETGGPPPTIKGHGTSPAFTAPYPVGFSCFANPPNDHGVPDSRMWDATDASLPRCFTLIDLPAEFAILHDYNMGLRQRKKSAKLQKAIPHFVIIPRVSGLTIQEFEKRVQDSSNWIPCILRAAASGTDGSHCEPSVNELSVDDDTDSPWFVDDLDGVPDARIRLLYNLAQQAYPKSSGISRMRWNDLMTFIATQKPQNLSALRTHRARAISWYCALRSLPMPQPMSTLEYAGILQSALESELGFEVFEDKYSEVICSSKSSDGGDASPVDEIV